MESVSLKWVALQLGIERLIIKNGKCIGYFIADQESPFYQTATFSNLIEAVQQTQGKIQLKEKQTQGGLRLLLVIPNVLSIQKLRETLSGLNPITAISNS